MGGVNTDDEIRLLDETPALGANTANLTRQTEEDNHDESGLPYAAWWKKQAASLYAHAKETNTFWSIFVAAAVMGLVILGQQWQQERWKVLHYDWKSGIDDESVGRTAGPISQFKGAIIGSNRQDLFISARASGEN